MPAIDDLPIEVVNFLNACGIHWPYIDEDVVWQFAKLVRQFSQAVSDTHAEATGAVGGIAQAYQGASTQAMHSGWADMTETQVDVLTAACETLAVGLDLFGDYIVVQKGLAIKSLLAMIAAFTAEQVGALFTGGLTELLAPLTLLAAQRVVESLEMDVEQYILTRVFETATAPLFSWFKSMGKGLDWSHTGAIAGDDQKVLVDSAALATHVAALRQLSGTLGSQAASMTGQIRALNIAIP
jgi:hypothetical protein